MRLHRWIAQTGLTSRRKAEELIQQGRVMVNGELVTEMGVKVEPDDRVEVDGEVLRALEQVTVMLNKPKGVVTTLDDPQGRRTIMDLLPTNLRGLKPVGRLDKDTEGLILLTTDGDLASRLTHAKYGVEKEYLAHVEGRPDEEALEKLRRGVFVDGRRTAPAVVRLIHVDEKRMVTALSLILHEGRKRQVRMMCEYVGHPVRDLRRIRIGHLVLKGMAPGEARLLPKKDLDKLRKAVGLE
jgi:23S rRNA pseudouridine2605 synthase